MIHQLIFFGLVVLIQIVQSRGINSRTDSHLSSSSVCSIHRPGFGQFEHVQISSYSIDIQLKNLFYNFKCSSIRIDVSVTRTDTDQIDRILQNIQTNIIQLDRLLPNENYSITIQLSDVNQSRLLPTQTFQTLPSSNSNILSLSGQDLLAIDQIESFLLPHQHIYIVTVPVHLQRSVIFGKVTYSYLNSEGKRVVNYQIVKPLDQNVITRLGRLARKTILFAFELPLTNEKSMNYSTSLQLFFPNNRFQSIVDQPIFVQSLPGISTEIFSSSEKIKSGRSIHVRLRHLCPSYMEVKGILYHNSLNKNVVGRQQCDMNKNGTSLVEISEGQCSLLFDQLQPEENYTLTIRATCPITSSYVFYDRTRSYTFRTSIGVPDPIQWNLSFDQEKNILSWTTKNNSNSTLVYRGPNIFYELLSKSNENWTIIYRGNQTHFQLPSSLLEKNNLTLALHLANVYGRQENISGELRINLEPIDTTKNNNQIVIFTIFISFLLLLLLFGFLFIGCYVRNKKFYGKLKQKYYQTGQMSDKELEQLRALTHPTLLKDNILYTWNHTPTNVDVEKLPKIERALIRLDRLIGKGAFGEVYAGTLNNEKSVAVKTLLNSASESQHLDFVKEAIIMNQFDHQHIVHLLGVCFQMDQRAQFLVLELMEQGDLQNFLRRSRPNKDQEQCRLSYDDCLDIARQIALGACYLEEHNYVHRDIAARNCLVSTVDQPDGKVLVKIGDFGLARMLSQQDYYRKTGEALLPVRWMAPESLLDAIFTSQSDIWSFGIVLWEIITLGQVPYSPLNNQQVISLITTTRGTLEKPVQCTGNLYELMLLCWNYMPENRVNFNEITTRLSEILADPEREQPSTWFSYDASLPARTVLDHVLSHIEPPTSISMESSDMGECRSSTSGCFSSMTESTSPSHHQQQEQQKHPYGHQTVPSYRLRLIDDTTSNDYAEDYDDNRSDVLGHSS